MKESVEASRITINKESLYSNKDIRRILGVDERLVKRYRDEGFLTYHRIGDKYWYKGDDIIMFLDGCKYEAFR